MRMISRLFIILLTSVICVSCKNNDVHTPKEPDANAGRDVSIKQFIQDQWDTYRGQPFGLKKNVYLNGKTDSSEISAYDMDWGTIFKTFFDTDISDPKFLGRYSFSSFPDDATDTQNFYYEAKEDGLFTRKLQVSADNVSHKIRSIY